MQVERRDVDMAAGGGEAWEGSALARGRITDVEAAVRSILGCCHGQSVSRRNSRLRVMSPPELEGTYGCASADFGFPQHRGSMTGVVVYPYRRHNRQACSNFDELDISLRSRPAGALPVFLLVDRDGKAK